MKTWLDMVAAAYRVDVGDTAWLDGVVAAVRPQLDQGLGIYAYYYHATPPTQYRREDIRFYGCSPQIQDFATRMVEAVTPEVVRDVLLSHPFGTASSALGRGRLARNLAPTEPPFGIADSIGINAVDPVGNGCVVNGLLRRLATLPRRDISLWTRVTAHFAAGLRLRRGLAVTEAPSMDSADAIVEPGGRVQHAVGDAAQRGAREALLRAAANVDRARSRRTSDALEAMELWRALVSGRWSIVDRFDTDGRRFFVAWRNDPALPPSRQLSARELQVASYAALGHGNKMIAYSLGLSATTVATHLSAAQTKLGLRSRVELIAVIRSLRWSEPSAPEPV